jgi:hypothetical protein
VRGKSAIQTIGLLAPDAPVVPAELPPLEELPHPARAAAIRASNPITDINLRRNVVPFAVRAACGAWPCVRRGEFGSTRRVNLPERRWKLASTRRAISSLSALVVVKQPNHAVHAPEQTNLKCYTT